MVRFFCFHAHIHNHKLKKTGQPPADTMQKSLQDLSQSKVSKDSPQSTSPDQLLEMTGNAKQEDANRANHMASIIENSRLAKQTCGLKNSQSLGSMSYGDGSVAADNDTEDGRVFSCDSSQCWPEISDSRKAQGLSISNRFKDNVASDSLRPSPDPVTPEAIFFTDDLAHREMEGAENAGSSLFCESVGDTGNHTPDTAQMIVKSCSVPNFDASLLVSGGCSPCNDLPPPSRSFEDLQLLDPGHGEMPLHEMEGQANGCQSREDIMHETEKIDYENLSDDGNDSYRNVARDWRTSVVDEVNPRETLQEESTVQYFNEFPSNDFKIKRIEEWVSDLQLCSLPDGTTEVYEPVSNEVKQESSIGTSSSAGRIDSKATVGVEAAKRYISSMTSAATTAQLTNHGLVVIPFLSAFVSLKVLNLSANSIGKITAGALPRGLHSLNLSKNNIANIEGLRELTRLRVLDLSYNRIWRIGHGLASCSSLKELYLAGNKISEVEGLHRLLKLCILDLRFNKISTTKSLGQLAANYNSLQVISLEGNPAQKNVGDDQLKKQLQGLLPHLVYYNRQPTKGSSTLKDGSDRSVRLGISSHQFEHGARPDHKGARKTTHSHRGQGLVSPRQSRLRHVPALPPTGSKVNGSIRHHHHLDISNRQFEYKSDSLMRRSRSLGTLTDL